MLNRLLRFGGDNESARRRWLKRALDSIPAGKRLLDAGAGELRNKPLCSHLTYVSQDFCQYEGRGDGAGLQVGSWDTGHIDIVSDIVSIPQPDSSFDVVLCSEVLEHLPDPALAIREFSRLLQSGGQLILTAPFCSLTHFSPYHYATGFGRYWYEHHLSANGFEIEELTPNGDWFDYVAQELRRLPAMGSSYSSKVFGLISFAAAIPCIFFMYLLKRRQKRDSSEILCYGWHVVARRVPLPVRQD